MSLTKPVPLYFVYITAWATEDGVVQFRRDIYLKDGVGQVARPTDRFARIPVLTMSPRSPRTTRVRHSRRHRCLVASCLH